MIISDFIFGIITTLAVEFVVVFLSALIVCLVKIARTTKATDVATNSVEAD